MDWTQLLMQVGWPSAALLAVLWLIYRAGGWFGPNVLLPVKDRLVRFFDQLAGDVGAIRKDQAHTALNQARCAEALDRIERRLEGDVPVIPFRTELHHDGDASA